MIRYILIFDKIYQMEFWSKGFHGDISLFKSTKAFQIWYNLYGDNKAIASNLADLLSWEGNTFLICHTFWALHHVIWLILESDRCNIRHFKEIFKMDAGNDRQSVSY